MHTIRITPGYREVRRELYADRQTLDELTVTQDSGDAPFVPNKRRTRKQQPRRDQRALWGWEVGNGLLREWGIK